ncbi:MAG: bacillithiol biosynthesis protein BshC [Candidatus Heimdallarchaeaceae archaeon]
MNTAGDLYSSYIWENIKHPYLEYFYNFVPKTFHEALEKVSKLPEVYIETNTVESLKKILLSYHEKLGLLTDRVRSNIHNINNGVVLAGQQATIFGGVSLIGNKIAATVTLSELSKEYGRKLSPVFLVNTHDVVQPEITTIHMPNAQTSFTKPISLISIQENIASFAISMRNFDWLDENLKVIKNIFLEFRSLLPKEKQNLFLERVEHILTFMRETYRSSFSFGDWAALIYGIQANIINDWGLVLFPTSHPEIRELLVKGYKPILKRRDEYIEEFNKASNKLFSLGLRPTTPKKEKDYSPFFYECENGHRVVLSCKEEEDSLIFSGKCKIDGQEISFDIDKEKINLEPYARNLAARLDTNQATFQSVMPVYLRVSGPGEINYNAQIIPAVRKVGVQFPVLLKYTRMVYNSNWIEEMSNSPELKEYSLITPELFKLLGQISKAKKKNEKDKLFENAKSLRAFILEKLEKIKQVDDSPTSKVSLLKSWQWGIYTRKKTWQEVSYPWFCLASITGLSDYLRAYKRQYSKYSPVGGIQFLNTHV